MHIDFLSGIFIRNFHIAHQEVIASGRRSMPPVRLALEFPLELIHTRALLFPLLGIVSLDFFERGLSNVIG